MRRSWRGVAVFFALVLVAATGLSFGPVAAQDQTPEPLEISDVTFEVVDGELVVRLMFADQIAPELLMDDGQVFSTTALVELHTDDDCTAIAQLDLFASDGFAFPTTFYTGESCPPDAGEFVLEAEMAADLEAVMLRIGPVPGIDDFFAVSLRAVTLVNGPDGPAIASFPPVPVSDGGTSATAAADGDGGDASADETSAAGSAGGEQPADASGSSESADVVDETEEAGDAEVTEDDRATGTNAGPSDSGGGNGVLIGGGVIVGVIAIGTTMYAIRRRSGTGEESLGEQLTEEEAAALMAQVSSSATSPETTEVTRAGPPPGTAVEDVTDEHVASYEARMVEKEAEWATQRVTDTDGVQYSDETIVVGESADAASATVIDRPGELADAPLDTYDLDEHGVMQPPSVAVPPEVELAGPVVRLVLAREPGRPTAQVTSEDRFIVQLKLPRTDDLPRYLDVTVSAGGTSENLTLETTGGVGATATFTSAPITVEHGGEGMKVWFPMLDITTGGIGAIDAKAGDNFTITFGTQSENQEDEAASSTLTVTVHPSWVQRMTADLRDEIVRIVDAHNQVVTLISDLPEDDEVARDMRQEASARDNMARHILTNHLDNPNKSDREKLAAAIKGVHFVRYGWSGSRFFDQHVKELDKELEEQHLVAMSRRMRAAMFHATFAQTPAPVVMMVWNGNDLLSDPARPRTGDSWERVLTAVNTVSWAIIGGYTGSPGSRLPTPRHRIGGGRRVRTGTGRSVPAQGPAPPVIPPRQPPAAPVRRHATDAAPAGGGQPVPAAPASTGGRPGAPAPAAPDVTPEPLILLADEAMRNKASRMPRKQGFLDVYIHGKPDGGFWFETDVLPPSAALPEGLTLGFDVPLSLVVEAIKKTPGYRPGMPIRLFSCHSARNNTGRGVAIQLRTHVVAPTRQVMATPGRGTHHDVGGQTVQFGPTGNVVREFGMPLPTPQGTQ